MASFLGGARHEASKVPPRVARINAFNKKKHIHFFTFLDQVISSARLIVERPFFRARNGWPFSLRSQQSDVGKNSASTFRHSAALKRAARELRCRESAHDARY